ncbi:MAG: LytTR family DNA-binding domain-containing protein [Bacteroidales bacterium]|nr:LytTR family DNA-binding domain-containing protein [Bacteroidales bacterium]
MKVLIVEDEEIAAGRLAELLHETEAGIEIMNIIGSVDETVSWLETNTPDLMFFDIQLSDGISFSIFDKIDVRIPVIFTTAYDQYAIRAFKLHSIDYLLKPVNTNDLSMALKKYHSLNQLYGFDYSKLSALISEKKPEYKQRFTIQAGEKIKLIEVKDIAWFFAMGKGVYLKTTSGQACAVDYTLDQLEGQLNPAVFYRINRKIIVQLNSIQEMYAWSRGRLKLVLKPAPDDADDAVVSVERSQKFRQWINR